MLSSSCYRGISMENFGGPATSCFDNGKLTSGAVKLRLVVHCVLKNSPNVFSYNSRKHNIWQKYY